MSWRPDGYSALCAVCKKMTKGKCGHEQPQHGPPSKTKATQVKVRIK